MRLTESVLDGLTEAHERLVADPPNDLTDSERADVEAAGKWIRHQWAKFRERKAFRERVLPLNKPKG